MASPNPSIAATTHSNFVKGEVVDAVTTATPLYAALKELGNIDYGEGGTSYRPPPIRYQSHTIEPWDGRNVINMYEPDLFANADHPWCGLVNTWVDNEWDALENQAGPERIAAMYDEVADALKDDWLVYLESILFVNGATSVPAGLLGLPAFMKSTGTYGGLAQTTNWWKPTILDGTTGLTPKTFKSDPKAYLKNLMNTIANKSKTRGIGIMNRPDFGMTTQAIFEHLLGFYEEKQYQAATVSTKQAGQNNMSVKAEGADIYWSGSCPTGNLYVMRLKKLRLVFQTKAMFGTRTIEIAQPIGNAYQSWMKFQLVTNDVRANGMINNISV